MINLSNFIRKCSDLYLYGLILKIPPEYQGFIEWLRIIFWLYPKHVYFPLVYQMINGKYFKKYSSARMFVSFIPTPEGIGGQLSRYTTALILADKYGLEYVHHPFAKDFHTPKLDWESFLGFNRKARTLEVLADKKNLERYLLPRFDLRYLKNLQMALLNRIIELRRRLDCDTLFFVTSFSFYPNNEYTNWPSILRRMKQMYFGTKKPRGVKNLIKKNNINVAVLVRRGEIEHLYNKKYNQGLWRWIDISWYKSVFEKLNFLYDSKLNISVFSDSRRKAEFSSLEKFPNLKILLLKDDRNQPFTAFDTMSKSDVVICGLSGFSYLPASFSEGAKIVPPSKVKVNYFPDESVKGWFSSDEQGNFDTEGLRKYVKSSASKRQ